MIKQSRYVSGYVALIIFLTGVAWQSASAQDATSDEIEEVVVTGTRIRQNPLDAASPIMNIDASDLQRVEPNREQTFTRCGSTRCDHRNALFLLNHIRK